MLAFGLILIEVLLLPLFCFTLEFSHIIYAKIRLQSALDQATYKSGEILTEHLNKIVALNKEASEAFIKLQNEFRTASSDIQKQAAAKVETLHQYQNGLLEQMDEESRAAYVEACESLRATMARHDPQVIAKPIYGVTLSSGDCVATLMLAHVESAEPVDLNYAYIESHVFDPTAYNDNQDNRYPARPEFIKNIFPLAQFGAVATLKVSIPVLRGTITLKAMSAAQPFGGNVARFEDYRTALIPQETLWSEGVVKENL